MLMLLIQVSLLVLVAGEQDLSGTDLSELYCEIKDKYCPGGKLLDLLLAADAHECHDRCNRNLLCLGIFYSSNQWCNLRSTRCITEQLLTGEPGTIYYRLKNKEKCPSGQREYDHVTVIDKPLDLSDTDLSPSYCEIKDKYCPGGELLELVFAADPHECHARCNRNLLCLSAFYSSNQWCNLRSTRCTTEQLLTGTAPGTFYYRLKKKEKCPSGQCEYVEASKPYSDDFLLIPDKTCPGHNLYPAPLVISPYQECLKKCAMIKSCTGVDFNKNVVTKCSPKNYECSEHELVQSVGTNHYTRIACRGKEQLAQMVVGARVKRDCGWKSDDADGSPPGLGTIIEALIEGAFIRIKVKWDHDGRETYSVLGFEGVYELQLAL